MIFQATWQAVLDGSKSETRRIVKPGEWLSDESALGVPVAVYKKPIPYERLKWQVGRTYAIQPGRGQKAVGRIRLLNIRQERLQDITELEAKAEGVKPYFYPVKISVTPRGLEQGGYLNYIKPYRLLWNTIHTKRGERWDDNPLCWVLRFELVEDSE
jgi:hypothetical protein